MKGVGAGTSEKLAKLGLETLGDLLLHLPFRYEDRTRLVPLAEVAAGQSALLRGRIDHTEVVGRGRRSLICRVTEDRAAIYLRFFHFGARQINDMQPGRSVQCFGEIRAGYYGLEIVHPEYRVLADAEATAFEPRLVPVYHVTEGLRQATVRRLIQTGLEQFGDDPLDPYLTDVLQRSGTLPAVAPAHRAALQLLHQPPPDTPHSTLDSARRRLAAEELLAHRLSATRARRNTCQLRAPVLAIDAPTTDRFWAALPFPPTSAQRRVVQEIAADLASGRPMLRLVQGDVGSGKTVVAAYAAWIAHHGGYQTALMAPTELLAEQHARTLSAWLQPLGVSVALLTGQMRAATRASLQSALSDGAVHVLIGTHALFQDSTVFAKLGLAIVDEQHRFGVHQRLALRAKSGLEGEPPHQLVMTATPIPRTLAMLEYADLDISVIDELPPGRTPVKTTAIPATRRDEVIARIAAWHALGKQTYWVCPLIEESEVLTYEAAEATVRALTERLPDMRIGLVHGRMKSADKDNAMQAFKEHALDLLVATTVIEVGVDVPNAGLMIIDNAERLGLAQLHQLRGRVGRGPGESYCLLLFQPPLSNTARERLGILRETNDGFLIAEKDLQLRGPGEVLGTRQTGLVRFKVADLSRDAELLEPIRTAAELWIEHQPALVDPLIQRWLPQGEAYADV